jgi:hypothetical protein
LFGADVKISLTAIDIFPIQAAQISMIGSLVWLKKDVHNFMGDVTEMVSFLLV